VSPGASNAIHEAVIDIAEEPIRDLAHLRDVELPASLVARVMTRVADPVAPTLWQWLWRPMRIELHISPAGVVALAAFVGAGIALFVAR
jgi:hypothetical protein